MDESHCRICYLASANSVHTIKWACHFARLGYQVHIISMHLPIDRMPGVMAHYLGPTQVPKRQGIAIWRYLLSLSGTRALLHRIQPQILHAHYASGYGLWGALAGFHPYIISAWGTDVSAFPRRSRIHRTLLKFNLSRADYICSTSRYLARETQKYTTKDIILTPFGVDCEQFQLKPKEGKKEGDEIIIGTVKTLEEGYGIEYLIRAFAIVVRNQPSHRLRLMIIGSGSQRKWLEQLTKVLSIEHVTQFVGQVPHHRVPEYMHRFSIFVAPSIHQESFGVAVLEASACGLPVVVSEVGGLPEVVDHQVTGLIVPPRNAIALADALERLVNSHDMRKKMGGAGRTFVLERYAWNTTARAMEELYQRILIQQTVKLGKE